MAKGFICTSTEPVVETKAGKLRGFKLGDVYTFYGVQYGTAKRFEQPEPVPAWEGVKDALAYGYISYPLNPDSPNGDITVPHRFWPKSEDCLNLNVWTRSIDKTAKKAVMVWLHGGGLGDGSSIEMPAYDGNNLAEYGDVVVVSVNHRLNVFGFLDVSEFGEKYANSQNAGMADLVMALQWVHDNIEAFGGDPENVTIFGQSGGGTKVTTLMQIPAADGLFQRAIVQSGSSHMSRISWKSSAYYAHEMLKLLGTDDFNKLLEVPAEELLNLARTVSKNSGQMANGLLTWGPLENGWFDRALLLGSTEHSKKVSLLIGTCLGEFNSFTFPTAGRTSMTKEEKEAKVFERFGKEAGEKLLKLFYEAYPEHDALDAIMMDDDIRDSTMHILDMRARDGSVPTYAWLLAYNFPIDDGKAAWHCAEIPFVFHNIEKAAICNEAEVGERLQNEMYSAWVNFAKTGDPSSELLPDWRPWTVGDEVTMVFDRKSEAKSGHDRDLVYFHQTLKAEFEHPDMLM